MKKIKMILMGLLVLTFNPFLSSCGNKVVTVSFETNCDAVVAAKQYTLGQSFSLPTALYKYGMKLHGWCYDAELTKEVQHVNFTAPKLNIKSDATLYAKWVDGEYLIHFDTDTEEYIEPMTIKLGQTVTLPTPSAKTIGIKSYDFDYWYYIAEDRALSQNFTLNYPEDINLKAYYKLGVNKMYTVDEENRYVLASSTRSCTLIDGYEMVYGTYEIDIALDKADSTGFGVIFNADLGNAPAPLIAGCEYYYMHHNATTGATQLALVHNGTYTSLKVVSAAANNTSFVSKLEELRNYEVEEMVFHLTIDNNPEDITVYIDDVLLMSVPRSHPSMVDLDHTGIGLRSYNSNVYFSNVEVSNTHHQIKFDTGDGKPVKTLKVEKGTDVLVSDLPIAIKLGYDFEGWYFDDGTKFIDSYTLNSNITLHARFSKIVGGAFVYFETGIEQTIEAQFVRSGEEIGTLPTLICPGLTFKGWQLIDGESTIDINENTVLVPADYQGESKNITLTASWQEDGSPFTENLDPIVYKGRFDKSNYYGYTETYTCITKGIMSVGEISEGRFSTFVKFNAYGNCGMILGATFLDNYQQEADEHLMCAGSSYYYWNITNNSGDFELVKVTHKQNPDTTNPTTLGYDVLASGSITDFRLGGRYKISVEIYNSYLGRALNLFVNDELVSSAIDDGSIAGAILTGNKVGFRNDVSGSMYYGIYLQNENELENAVLLNLDANEGTCLASTYTRHAGWDFSNLPEASRSGYTFAGWTRVKDNPTTLIKPSSLVTLEDHGSTIYAYYVPENETLILFNGNNSDEEISPISVQRNSTLIEELQPAVRFSYGFDGWYDENETKVTIGYQFSTPIVVLTAKWKAHAENILEIENCSNSKGIMRFTDDGIYKKYHFEKTSLAIAPGASFSTGVLTTFIDASNFDTEVTNNSGIVFRASNLQSASGPTKYSEFSCYFLNIGKTGNLILYDMSEGSAKKVNNVLTGSASAGMPDSVPSFTAKPIRFDIALKETAGKLSIGVFVNGTLVYQTEEISNPLTGTEVGLRAVITAGGYKTISYYGMSISDSVSGFMSSLTLNANGGNIEGQSTFQVFAGGKVVLPSATKEGETFLGYSEDQNATTATYQAGDTITVTSDTTLYAIFSSEG